MRRRFLGRAQDMQAAENDFRAPLSIPARELVRPLRERQMHADRYYLRKRLERRRSLQQIFVPVADFPMSGRRARYGGQRQGRRQHVLAKARVWVLAVERVDQ